MPGLFASAETTQTSQEQGANLAGILSRVFGHAGFRAHQQDVCEAAASGRDVLLVMPTGAGKSLCYQLPALARSAAGLGGTALVVSPLIALMDDQAGKLEALGLRVARVHSGLSRDLARQACRDYLSGDLDFLFIAPERMRVPGFPEMLAKRKPALVAIDEAHCISAWGHDFRPDYRTLGQHLPALRPAPIVALTATATPAVQRDIAVQLQLENPAVFITGFRRDNLHVEVLELSKPQRDEHTVKLLRDPAARPAIVYAPSRKAADELAGKLNAHFPARAYHAGLEGAMRESVQRDFLAGSLQAVVATIAFGMGVDKANVRTVIHTALPGSVEAYYQEIGRAGRDGLPSRTLLLYSFADRKTQEYFLERSYPARGELERVAAVLPEEWAEPEALQKRLKLDREAFDRAVEKLLAVGVAELDRSGLVRGTGAAHAWQPGYDAQVNVRRQQIDRMMAFAEGNTCRMAALVQHFGDRSDTRQECGACDVCRPGADSGHAPDAHERERLRKILKALADRSTSTTRLFTETAVTRDRKEFDEMLRALARAGLLTLANDTFRNPEGSEITYRKVSLTHEGRNPDDSTLLTVLLRGTGAAEPAPRGAKRKATVSKKEEDAPLTPGQQALEDKLRAWRLQTSRATGKPAFLVFADAVLRALARNPPANLRELEALPGIGQQKLDLYGAELLAICRESAVSPLKPGQRSKTPPLAEPAEDAGIQKPSRANASGKPSVAGSLRLEVTSQDTPPGRSTQRRHTPDTPIGEELTPEQTSLQARLQEWRRQTARDAGLPSFFVLSDTALREIALAAPRSLVALSGLRGMGSEKVERFGEAVLALCRS